MSIDCHRALRQHNEDVSTQKWDQDWTRCVGTKKLPAREHRKCDEDKSLTERSGTEAGGLDQPHLIAAGGEFPTLVALHDHTTT